MAADAQRDISRVPMHFTRLSDEQEIAIGSELAASYADANWESSLPKKKLSKNMSAASVALFPLTLIAICLQLHLMPDHNMINAFSLPGGPVYIGEGMLDQMETEDELANILAHEVEHIDHYHCVERMQIEAKLKNLNLEIIGRITASPLEFWQAGYHKDEEFEADREGVRLWRSNPATRPYGSVTLIHPLRQAAATNTSSTRSSPEQELSELAIQSLHRLLPLASAPLRAPRRKSIASSPKSTGKIARKQKPFHVEYEVHDGRIRKVRESVGRETEGKPSDRSSNCSGA